MIKLTLFIGFVFGLSIIASYLMDIVRKGFRQMEIQRGKDFDKAMNETIKEMKEKGIKRFKYGKVEIELK